MATSQFDEIQSFISKFCFISGQCLNANLNLNSFNGHIYASLNVELGKMPSPTNIPAFHEKPSRIRRRRRRQNMRNLKNDVSSKTDNVANYDAASAIPENDIAEAVLIQVDEDSCDSNFVMESNRTQAESPENVKSYTYSDFSSSNNSSYTGASDESMDVILRPKILESSTSSELQDDSCMHSARQPTFQSYQERSTVRDVTAGTVANVHDASARYWEEMLSMARYLTAPSNYH